VSQNGPWFVAITKNYDDKELCMTIMMKMWNFKVEVEMAKERKASG
jgi:hypothetical protein